MPGNRTRVAEHGAASQTGRRRRHWLASSRGGRWSTGGAGRPGGAPLGRRRPGRPGRAPGPRSTGSTSTRSRTRTPAPTWSGRCRRGSRRWSPGRRRQPDAGRSGRRHRDAGTAVLRGACGNSGTILSQLLRGIADAARGRDVARTGPPSPAALTPGGRRWPGPRWPGRWRARSCRSPTRPRRRPPRRGPGGASRSVAVVQRRPARRPRRRWRAPRTSSPPCTAGSTPAVAGWSCCSTRSRPRCPARDVRSAAPARAGPTPTCPGHVDAGSPAAGSPAHEVMYLLETTVDAERAGGSARCARRSTAWATRCVVVGGNGLWQVHAHVDDIGAAVEAGFGAPAGRTGSGSPACGQPGVRPRRCAAGRRPRRRRLVDGPGLAELLTSAGARVLDAGPWRAGLGRGRGRPRRRAGRRPAWFGRRRSPRRLRRRGRRPAPARGAEPLGGPGHRGAGRAPARAATRRATCSRCPRPRPGCRAGLVEVAEGEGVTSAGRCQAGDVLGHVDGDVAIIGSDLADVAAPGRRPPARRRRRAGHPGLRSPGARRASPRGRRGRGASPPARRGRHDVRRRAALVVPAGRGRVSRRSQPGAPGGPLGAPCRSWPRRSSRRWACARPSRWRSTSGWSRSTTCCGTTRGATSPAAS